MKISHYVPLTYPDSWPKTGWWCLLFLAFSGFARGGQLVPSHTPAAARNATQMGLLPATNRLTLALSLPLRNASALDDYLARLYNPASPDYHQYLTPAQFTEQFGPTKQDYQAVAAFASRHHLSVTHTHSNRLLLDVSGAVPDVEQAFHVTLHVYKHPTEARNFFAPDTEPSVEDGVPISEIGGLNNYSRPHPQSLRRETTAANEAAAPKTGSGAGGNYFGGDFRAAYLPGVALTGAGQQVGLLEFDGYYASDITAYETKAKLPAVPLQNVLLDSFNGVVVSADANIEVSLDIEMALAMAPGLSKIVVYEGNASDVIPNDVLNAIATADQVGQIGCSWGWGGGPSTTTDAIFKEMAAQGQSFFDAAGDSDAFTTGAKSSNGVDNPSLNNAPSSSPYITVVGGTTLTTTGPGGSWSSETVWNWGLDGGSYVGGSGGISSYYALPAWQAGVSMAANGGSTTFRNIPDVALTAANVLVYYGNGTNGAVGGTSCAAPLWAGLAALLNEQSLTAGGSTMGFLNPALYALGLSGGTNYTAAFHDITTGNNFSSASPSLFDAVAGYDLCTGWGTPAGASLINALAGPPEPLQIQPATGFTASGPVGGPFSITATNFALANLGTNALAWSAGNLPAWLTLTPASGTINARATNVITAKLNANASVLPAGGYTNSITFGDAATGNNQTRQFVLLIGQSELQNGGFETGDFSDWTLVGNGVVSAGGGNVTTYNAVEPASSFPAAVHSGNYGAFLGDTSLATLSQNVATVPGRSYFLSFWLDNPTSGSGQVFLADWNTNSAATNQIYYTANPPAFSWTNLTFVLTATGTNTLLRFGAANPPNYFGLDDVSVTPIPAPSFLGAAASANSFRMTWYATAGVQYQLLCSTNLARGHWTVLSTNTAAGATLSITNNTGADRQRFYRILQLP